MTTRKCRTCGQTQPSADFYANAQRTDGLSSNCKSCSRAYSNAWHAANGVPNPERKREIAAAWRAANPERQRATRRKKDLAKKYGLSIEDYEGMRWTQDDRCAICGLHETWTQKGISKPLSVDHDHATGKVRGLLCNSCNRGLGYFRDDPELMLSANAYLGLTA